MLAPLARSSLRLPQALEQLCRMNARTMQIVVYAASKWSGLPWQQSIAYRTVSPSATATCGFAPLNLPTPIDC